MISLTNKSGFTIIETIMAMALVALGVVTMLQLLVPAWQSAESADNKSRAVEVLQRELESTQALIANECNTITAQSGTKTVTVSSRGTGEGDITYSITKNVTTAGMGWNLTVTVTRGGTTLSATRFVLQQATFKRSVDYVCPPTPGPNLIAAGSEGV